MPRHPAAPRYARALFALCNEQGCTAAVQEDLAALAAVADRRVDYAALFEPFLLPAEQRREAWRELLADRAHPMTLRFVLFLVSKGRIGLLDGIIDEYDALCLAARGRIAAQIESAHPLAEGQLAAIIRRIEARVGGAVEALATVDPALIGGFKFTIGDTVHDFTVSHQLERLHRSLLSA